MVKTIMALYVSSEDADMVVEALLDSGFSHADIAVMSGSYWVDELTASVEQLDSHITAIDGHEVLLSVRASGPMAKKARDMICNSETLDLFERSGGWQDGWASYSIPVNFDQTFAEHIP